MPAFDDTTTTSAPATEVWKLLYDPSRFPQWWSGMGTVDPRPHEGRGDFTMFPAGYPDFPLPQAFRTDRSDGRVVVSCLTNDLIFEWRLTPRDGGTRIDVHVELPDREAHRLEAQRQAVARSLRNLARCAAQGSDP